MDLLDEMHMVTLTCGDELHLLSRAALCGHASVEDLRRDATAAARRFGHCPVSAALAFDRAFDACERVPGNEARGSAALPGGIITVIRSLAA